MTSLFDNPIFQWLLVISVWTIAVYNFTYGIYAWRRRYLAKKAHRKEFLDSIASISDPKPWPTKRCTFCQGRKQVPIAGEMIDCWKCGDLGVIAYESDDTE